MYSFVPIPSFTVSELEPDHLSPVQVAQIEAIFFEASGRSFDSAAERAVFRERWLGRYLVEPGDVLVTAQDATAAIVGYLIGALEDPAGQDRFADISYFRGVFRDLCRAYPAHLHINMAASVRGQGVGKQLVETFAARARAGNAPGMHVVTAAQARNISFYTRCGFVRLQTAQWNGRDVAFLGCRLAPAL